jgi:hypothetical protein
MQLHCQAIVDSIFIYCYDEVYLHAAAVCVYARSWWYVAL